MKTTIEMVLFYAKDIFIRQPTEGFKNIYKGIGSSITKPKNLLFIMLVSNFILISGGVIAAQFGKPLPILFYLIYSIALILFMVWKNIVGGDIKDRWKRHLNEKILEIEKEKIERFK